MSISRLSPLRVVVPGRSPWASPPGSLLPRRCPRATSRDDRAFQLGQPIWTFLHDQGGPNARTSMRSSGRSTGTPTRVRGIHGELRGRGARTLPVHRHRRHLHVPAQQRRRLRAVHRRRARDRPRRAARRDRQGRRGQADRRAARAADQLLRGGRRPGAAAELAQARRQRLRDRPDLGAEHRRGRRARDRARARSSARATSTRPATGCRSTASTPPTTSSTCGRPASSRR